MINRQQPALPEIEKKTMIPQDRQVPLMVSTYNAIRFVHELTRVVIAMKAMQVLDNLIPRCLRTRERNITS
jgi:hypothetical protein